MKKAILTVAMLAVVLVSCQDKTKEKLDEAKDAVSKEVEQKVDSITDKAELFCFLFLFSVFVFNEI